MTRIDNEIPIDREGRGTPQSLIYRNKKEQKIPRIIIPATPKKEARLIRPNVYTGLVWSPNPNTSTLVMTIPYASRRGIQRGDGLEAEIMPNNQMLVTIIKKRIEEKQ